MSLTKRKSKEEWVVVGSWDEAILINIKCQGRGVEKSKEEKHSRKSKFNLVAFLPRVSKFVGVF